MLFRFTRILIAVGLLAGLWGLSTVRQSPRTYWVRPRGAPPLPVKILQFYVNVGTLTAGQKAQLCYGVANAKSVRISPSLQNVYPSSNRCVEIGPEHTTHYTILAEGYDGQVAMQSLTLPVQTSP